MLVWRAEPDLALRLPSLGEPEQRLGKGWLGNREGSPAQAPTSFFHARRLLCLKSLTRNLHRLASRPRTQAHLLKPSVEHSQCMQLESAAPVKMVGYCLYMYNNFLQLQRQLKRAFNWATEVATSQKDFVGNGFHDQGFFLRNVTFSCVSG